MRGGKSSPTSFIHRFSKNNSAGSTSALPFWHLGCNSGPQMNDDVSFWRAGHLPTLLGAFLCFFVCSMCWLLIGGLGSSIAVELKLTSAQKGLLTAVPLLGGGLLR